MNGGWGISYEITLRWMPLDLTDDKSTLVPVMAWCRQATSHCLSQWWPRSMSPNGVTRPQWVKYSQVPLFGCCYTMVQINMMLHRKLQKLKENIRVCSHRWAMGCLLWGRVTFQFWYLVWLILEIWRYMPKDCVNTGLDNGRFFPKS